MDRMARQRPRTPGEEVGQKLVLARPQNTLSEVRHMFMRACARVCVRVYVCACTCVCMCVYVCVCATRASFGQIV